MGIYYLVDYENVQDSGLKNIDSLEKEDRVHIFYTKNAKKISLDINPKKYVSHKVVSGNQSLDKHLVSYLGYLLGVKKTRVHM